MLAIAGGKGGAGKTTTAAALAAEMAARGDAPLVVDVDLDMPDLHHVAEVARTPGLAAIAAGRDLTSLVQDSPRLEGAAVLPAGHSDSLSPALLSRIAAWDGPVLLDCPAGASEAASAPLRAADRALLVSTATVASLTDAAKTAATARALDCPPAGAILTRTSDQPGTASLLGCPILAAVPEVAPPVLENPDLRAPYRRVLSGLNSRNT
jgi:septum site-determining protein MinD